MGRTKGKASITNEQLAACVIKSTSFSDVLREFGLRLSGGSHAHYVRRIRAAQIDTSHFIGRSFNRGKVPSNRKAASDILKLRVSGGREKAHRLRRALIEIGRPYQCESCMFIGQWVGKPLTLEVDHLNRNWLDDRAENLRFLCPNCHSQEPVGG